jgi:hypothetical protein
LGEVQDVKVARSREHWNPVTPMLSVPVNVNDPGRRVARDVCGGVVSRCLCRSAAIAVDVGTTATRRARVDKTA